MAGNGKAPFELGCSGQVNSFNSNHLISLFQFFGSGCHSIRGLASDVSY